MTRDIMMEYFEWYLPADSKHWKRLKEDANHLKELGITQVWMPPAFKGTGFNDVGYGIYDLFDLGEFDQNGTVPTKYGTKEEYLEAISALKEVGIKTFADIVLNHKANGDHQETFYVLEMDPNDRQKPISDSFEIEGWTGFDFPGRRNTYNDFKWHWYHFTGLDYDARHQKNGIFMIEGDNKGWANSSLIDNENGNYDYLMYNDIDFKHPEVIQHLKEWVKWFIETTQVDGFRLDAIKHIDSYFMKTFINDIRTSIKPDLAVFGEYWVSDDALMEHYLDSTQSQFSLVDVPLHLAFFKASQEGNHFDLRQLFDGTLVKQNPSLAITFVENHDTQKGQALESTVEEWFKPLAYALILLRQEGTPCLFYGDYYGVEGENGQSSFRDIIDKLTYLRKHYTFGEQVDYLDHANCIAWAFLGDEDHQKPMAVILSNGDSGWKTIEIGSLHSGKTFIDYLGNHEETVTIDEKGWADFPVNAGSVSAWIEK